jgi:hypothetical protein
MPSKVSWIHDSDNRMLARYQHLYKSALKVKASQLQKIQRTETREVCISVLLKAVVICNNTLKEMGPYWKNKQLKIAGIITYVLRQRMCEITKQNVNHAQSEPQ